MTHFLSIVTISFNQAPYLRQCLDASILQKDKDVELIVVDPGSTDGSREIIASYGSDINHVVLEPDKGAADGLNNGFARASGKIGYFINSDDFLLPGGVKRLRDLWVANAGSDVVLADGWMVDGAGQPMRELRSSQVSLERLRQSRVRLIQQGMSFRMAKFREAGGFNPANRTCWDYELLVELALGGAKMTTEHQRIGAFRLYGESLSGGAAGQAHEDRYLADLIRIHERLGAEPFQREWLADSLSMRLRNFSANPAVALHRLSEIAIPGLMARRWAADNRA